VKKNKIILLGLISIVLAYANISAEDSTDSKAETYFMYVEGDVRIMENGTREWVEVTGETKLSSGDQIKLDKDSFAEVNLDENKKIELNEETMISVTDKDSKKTSLEVFYGALKAKVKKLPDEVMEIRTPVAVAAVRGTEFAVIHEEDKTAELEVYDGEVALANTEESASAEAISVTKDRWAKVTSGSKPEVEGKIDEKRALKWKHFKEKKEMFQNKIKLKKVKMHKLRLEKRYEVTSDPEKIKEIKEKLEQLNKEIRKSEGNIEHNEKSLKKTRASYAQARMKNAKHRLVFIKKKREKHNIIRLEKKNKIQDKREKMKEKIRKKLQKKRSKKTLK
jgi:hypothetical protein